jgi:hypothetical protein
VYLLRDSRRAQSHINISREAQSLAKHLLLYVLLVCGEPGGVEGLTYKTWNTIKIYIHSKFLLVKS